jgi:Na+/melibiose symporter-like transporter
MPLEIWPPCLYFGIFMNFMAIFYTDVFGITPAGVSDYALALHSNLGLDQ